MALRELTDRDCVAFLQWALPRLGLRWAGFRRVRRQVRKRIARRLAELGLPDVAAYQVHLEGHPGEWAHLDALCRIPISRFRRDGVVWDAMRDEVLPTLEALVAARGESAVRAWSLGCASGEEAYSLAILWRSERRATRANLSLHVTASDADAHLLERARRACYEASSLREVPPSWRGAFEPRAGRLCVRPAWREGVEFVYQDVRREAPRGPFHLVLCRNVVLTYFEPALQCEALERVGERLVAGGALVVGLHELLPPDVRGYGPWGSQRAIHRREP